MPNRIMILIKEMNFKINVVIEMVKSKGLHPSSESLKALKSRIILIRILVQINISWNSSWSRWEAKLDYSNRERPLKRIIRPGKAMKKMNKPWTMAKGKNQWPSWMVSNVVWVLRPRSSWRWLKAHKFTFQKLKRPRKLPTKAKRSPKLMNSTKMVPVENTTTIHKRIKISKTHKTRKFKVICWRICHYQRLQI